MAPTSPIIPDSTPAEQRAPRVLAVIPARLASTRLPRKVLREIAGKPMLQWVYEAALHCPALDQVVIATDSDEVADLCRSRNWPFRLTSPHLASGSDRVDAVAREIPAEIYVNIQGDEPLLQPAHISALLQPFGLAGIPGIPGHPDPGIFSGLPAVEVSTLRVRCPPEELTNPNAVKVVSSANGCALYFSRATLPYSRDGAHPEVWKHLGLYAYRAAALRRFTSLPIGTLERAERLEQLRFLENNIPLHVATTDIDTIGVDTEADLQRVDAILRARARLR